MGSTTAKALRYGPCVTRASHSFTCHPFTNHTCLYSPAARYHCALWLVLIAPTHERMAFGMTTKVVCNLCSTGSDEA